MIGGLDPSRNTNPLLLTAPIRILFDSGAVEVRELGTTNKNKRQEFFDSGLNLDPCGDEIEEVQVSNNELKQLARCEFQAVGESLARRKALNAYLNLGRLVIPEDTSLGVEACPEVTGPNIKLWCGSRERLGQLCKLVHDDGNPRATAFSILALSNGVQHYTWVGKLEGRIALIPRGKNGHGWDCIFEPEPLRQQEIWSGASPRTLAEMTYEEKMEFFSLRKRAVAELRKDVLL